MKFSAALALAPLLLMGAAPPPTCDMALAFAHPDDDGDTTTAVWRDTARKALLFGDALHVNTDGTKRSYKVTDFWGSTDALNNLCNAMHNKCAELTADPKTAEPKLRARRVATEDARSKGWPEALWTATRINDQIIPRITVNGRKLPCPEVDGFLVSATALEDPTVTDVCNLSRYVDALAVNAIVIPGSPAISATGVRTGDLAVVMKPDGTIFYAVVGDTGPAEEIGEVSIALAGAMLGKTKPPANYSELRGRGVWAGKGWDVPKGFVLILPGTRDAARPYMTADRIEAAARPLFETWGGSDRLKACATIYRRS